MEKPKNRAEAERWIEVAGKLLEARDLPGSKRFAKRAQEADPQVDGVDQIIAVIDVLSAGEKRINNHFDWYAILQLERGSTHDVELIKRQYRKLALLLHPDKNKSPLSAHAFKLVCDAWAFLSDPSKKSLYDNEFNLYIKFDPIILKSQRQHKTPVRQSVREKKQSAKAAAAAAAEQSQSQQQQNFNYRQPEPPSQSEQASSRLSTFWTVCPYCYHLYEYPRVYEDCCLRCQNCKRAFQGVVVPSPPPPPPPSSGSDQNLYYCSWSFFPIRYTPPENLVKNANSAEFPVNVTEEKDDDVHGGKKIKTGNVDDDVSRSIQMEGNGNGNEFEGGKGNVGGANKVEGQKSVRIKTTARKLVRQRPFNQTINAEAQSKVVGGNSDRVGMDLNMEIKPEAEQPRETDGVEREQIGTIDKEATEGIGFFEGLDDILGSLPV